MGCGHEAQICPAPPKAVARANISRGPPRPSDSRWIARARSGKSFLRQPRTSRSRLGAAIRKGQAFLTGSDLAGINAGAGQALGQQARARAAQGAVNGGEQREPARAPPKVWSSSKLRRVAASMARVPPAHLAQGLDEGLRALLR